MLSSDGDATSSNQLRLLLIALLKTSRRSSAILALVLDPNGSLLCWRSSWCLLCSARCPPEEPEEPDRMEGLWWWGEGEEPAKRSTDGEAATAGGLSPGVCPFSVGCGVGWVCSIGCVRGIEMATLGAGCVGHEFGV